MSVPIMVVVNAGVRHEGDGEGEGEGERKRETAGKRACVRASMPEHIRPAGRRCAHKRTVYCVPCNACCA